MDDIYLDWMIEMQKRIVICFMLILLITLAGVSASAQSAGYNSAAEALSQALSDYMVKAGEEGLWSLGDIVQEGGYAYSLAKHVNNSDTESGNLMILAKTAQDGLWYARTPGSVSADDYNAWLDSYPNSMLSEFEKSYFYQYSPEEISILSALAVDLHRLPWPIRETARVTQKDGQYHTNQIDFVMRDSADVYASKPGVVIFKKESSNIGGCDMNLWEYANLVVIQHSPTEYSWYFHLAMNSVTVEVGDLIGYGTKIGEQGNTGYACGTTGIHLHFMVSTSVPSYWPNPENPAFAPWPPGGSLIKVDFVESTWGGLVVGNVYPSQNAPAPGICASGVSQVSLYDSTYCSDYLNQVPGKGLYELSALSSNDKLESIEIPAGMAVNLYRDENEVGDSVCLTSTDEMLWDDLFPDGAVAANRVSWIRVFPSLDCALDFSKGVLLYSSVNFAGAPAWGMVGERSTNGPQLVAKSILIPPGYFLRIWDQDGKTGNTICMNTSLPDLSVYWGDRPIESLRFSSADLCGGQGISYTVPLLISPINNGTVYGMAAPEFCWETGALEQLDFFVEITGNGNVYQSGWISKNCWQAESLIGLFGDYSWMVKSRTGTGEVSNWSATYDFSYVEDVVSPTLTITTPVEGGDVVYPRAHIMVDAFDLGGVKTMYFFAWYDDGSGAGHDWHFLGVDADGSDGWYYLWDLTPLANNLAAVWVYGEDYTGNYGSAYTPQVTMTDTVTFGDGFETRGGDDDGSGITFEDIAPTTFPAIPGSEETNGGQSGSGATEGQDTETEQLQPPVSVDPPQEEVQPPVEPPASSEEVTLSPVIAIQPVNGAIFWSEHTPNLCWQPASEAQSYKVRVIGEAADFTSGWLSETCWQPDEIAGELGEYTWQVKYKDGSGNQSDWSEGQVFFIERDQILPEIAILDAEFLQTQGSLRLEVSTVVEDFESGVGTIFLLAYYDNGEGASWHVIEEVTDPSSSNVDFIWNIDLDGIEIRMLWVYAIDHAGNIGSANLLGDQIQPIVP